MKLWILGGNGLVGSTLQKVCMQRGISFVSTGREVDISDQAQVERFFNSPACAKVTHLVNCAAFTNVDQAEEQKELAYQINAKGPENLGVLAHTYNLSLVHLSTDYVFDGKKNTPYTEEDSCAPLSWYAHTKREGEKLLAAIYPQACIIRTAWVFGKGGKNFISSLVEKLQKEKTLSVASTQKASPTFAPDLAHAILDLLDHPGLYHFTNKGEASHYEIAKKIQEEALKKEFPLICTTLSPLSSLPLRAQRPSYSALALGKVETVLGRPSRSWEETISEHLKSYEI